MSSEEITIEKIVNGGYGLGRLASGQVVLVRHVLPGEIVQIEPAKSKKKKDLLFARLSKIIKRHPRRITPPCKYYLECGGCNMQHCDYPYQLEIKQAILRDLLQRQKLTQIPEADNFNLPVPSPLEFNYRQRIRLQVGKNGELGFLRFQSHEIIGINHCLLAKGPINKALQDLSGIEDGRRLLALANELELQHNPATDLCVCIFKIKQRARPGDISAGRNLCKTSDCIERVFFTGTNFAMEGPYFSTTEYNSNRLRINYSLPGRSTPFELNWEAGGFCQVNLEQNRKMIETVLDYCSPASEDRVLDLYCGMGNFSIALGFQNHHGSQVKEILGIEGQGSAIRSAKFNSKKNNLKNIRYLKSQVLKACEKLVAENEIFDSIIIDPPRQGAPDLAPQLASLCRKKLVYISCDPATLCRDLRLLVKHDFKITRIQPFDMFPQTHHIETVVLLEK